MYTGNRHRHCDFTHLFCWLPFEASTLLLGSCHLGFWNQERHGSSFKGTLDLKVTKIWKPTAKGSKFSNKSMDEKPTPLYGLYWSKRKHNSRNDIMLCWRCETSDWDSRLNLKLWEKSHFLMNFNTIRIIVAPLIAIREKFDVSGTFRRDVSDHFKMWFSFINPLFC